jgi:hypothetical protein
MDKTPAPRRARHDGWTPARQHDFIRALIDGHSILRAAAMVGMSARSAYGLREHPAAADFRAAWDAALAPAFVAAGPDLIDTALARETGPYRLDGLACTRARPIPAARLMAMIDRAAAKVEKMPKMRLS